MSELISRRNFLKGVLAASGSILLAGCDEGGGSGGGGPSEAVPTPIGANLPDEAFTNCIEGGKWATVLTTPGVQASEIVIIKDRKGRIVYRGPAANAPGLPYNLGPQALGPTGKSDGAYLWSYEDQQVHTVCQSQ